MDFFFFFFFQAEDGIRDLYVTGVQTCALPICERCQRARITVEKGAMLVRAILDFMRRRRAVSFEFYQRYLDPRRVPWSYLTVEPYNLSVGEHEREIGRAHV